MILDNNPVPVQKDGKWYLCKPMLIEVRGGKNVAYITEDGTEIKREPLHRYNNRIKRRKSNNIEKTTPKSKTMRGTDALNANIPVPVFEILADMVESLQQSKYNHTFLIKGGFTLMAAVKQKGKVEYIRGTTDIDMDFFSLQAWEEFIADICGILNSGSRRGLEYSISHRRGINAIYKSDRLHIDVVREAEKLATVGIDMNVKDLITGTEYSISELTFTGADLYSMLVDKLVVASTNEVLRRNKDMIDLFIMSKIFTPCMPEIRTMITRKKREISLPPFILDGNNIDGLRHAYDKQKIGESMGLSFDEVYRGMLDFITLIFQDISQNLGYDPMWDCEKGVWFKNERV